MANLETRESSSSSVIEVGYNRTMNEEDIVDAGSARIVRVSKPLRDSNDHLYTPHLVSIGPFHYGKEELEGMEPSKSEAVRRMQMRIQRNAPHVSMKSIVEETIQLKDNEIREFYGEAIPCTPIELAWMVTRDACFLFEFLVNYAKTYEIFQGLFKEEITAFSWKLDSVFDASYQDPIRGRLIDDILLFEKQIPLWILQDILQMQMGSNAIEKMEVLTKMMLMFTSRQNIFMWYIDCPFSKCCHVLEVVYTGMVGDNVMSCEDTEALQLQPSPPNCLQIWFKNGVDSMKAICGRLCNPCLHFLPSNNCPGEAFELDFLKLPSAVELTRAGVKISTVVFGEAIKGQAFRWIRFDEKTSTLHLPQIRVTPETDSVMRSLLAMELSIHWRYNSPRISPFAMFIDEMIESEEDVAVLRQAEVIKNFLGSNQDVAQLFNSLPKGIAPLQGCKAIDNARMGLHKYTRRKYKILWSEFISAYFSKPWLVAGSIAAVLLLLMTVAQVFCLFFTCNS